MKKLSFNAAHQRVWIGHMFGLFLFIVGQFAGQYLVPLGGQASQATRILAAALQIVPVLLYIAATTRFLHETDDYMRQIGSKALAFAGGWTVTVLAVLAPLQHFELIPDFPEAILLVIFQIAAVGRFAVLTKRPVIETLEQG
jgi:hypothetical protein